MKFFEFTKTDYDYIVKECMLDEEYQKWLDIKKRCYNPNSKDYNNYGARGITMCDDWKKDFMSFYNWAIENGYYEHLNKYGSINTTIDRIDVNGNYEPSNCRWATQKEQANNKRH